LCPKCDIDSVPFKSKKVTWHFIELYIKWTKFLPFFSCCVLLFYLKRKHQYYPNPSNGLITLNKKAIDNQHYTVIITDVMGKIVQQYNWNEMANNNQLAIDLSAQQAGVYQVTIATEQSRYSAKVVLVK
jgi:hypothetical protein